MSNCWLLRSDWSITPYPDFVIHSILSLQTEKTYNYQVILLYDSSPKFCFSRKPHQSIQVITSQGKWKPVDTGSKWDQLGECFKTYINNEQLWIVQFEQDLCGIPLTEFWMVTFPNSIFNLAILKMELIHVKILRNKLMEMIPQNNFIKFKILLEILIIMHSSHTAHPD